MTPHASQRMDDHHSLFARSWVTFMHALEGSLDGVWKVLNMERDFREFTEMKEASVDDEGGPLVFPPWLSHLRTLMERVVSHLFNDSPQHKIHLLTAVVDHIFSFIHGAERTGQPEWHCKLKASSAAHEAAKEIAYLIDIWLTPGYSRHLADAVASLAV